MIQLRPLPRFPFRLVLLLALVAGCGDPPALASDASTDDAATLDDGALGDARDPRDPASDGDFAVDTMSVAIPGATAGRSLPSTVFTPTGAPAPRPVVVISPGFQMDRVQYTSYARHLATWGFVVILTDYADRGFFAEHQKLADDVGAVIDWALANDALAIDPQRIATAGHSLGGKISVFAAAQDPRISVVIGWDPVDSQNPSVAPEKMTTFTAALALVGETTNGAGGGMPCAPTADNFQTFYAAAPIPAISITVTGADHMDWVDDPSCGFCGFCTAGSASPELSRTVSRRLGVAWLRRQLFQDLAMDAWLDAPPELAAGMIAVLRR